MKPCGARYGDMWVVWLFLSRNYGTIYYNHDTDCCIIYFYKLWLAAKHWDVGVPMYGSVPMRPSHNLVTSNGQPPPHLLPSQYPPPTPNFWQLRPRSRSKSVCYSQARVLVNFSCLSLGGMLPIVNGIYSCLHRTWKQCVLCTMYIVGAFC